MKKQFDNIRNKLLLTFVTFCLYYMLSFMTDKNFVSFYVMSHFTLVDYLEEVLIVFLISFFFVELSIFYSRFIFRRLFSYKNPYRSLFIHDILLLILNNVTAYLLSTLNNVFLEGSDEDYFHQGLYIFSVLVTFISGIYTNASYLNSYMEAEDKKREMEIKLLKEKELSARAQLDVLKLQIDPHFMFNNFSILSELIQEDVSLADKFLNHLSKVYRYVIQNLKQDLVTIGEEMAFLDSYIYLIKIRYEVAIHISIEKEMYETKGFIPPVCLQMLVENAIKHNCLSLKSPLEISIYRDKDFIIVKNNIRPITSDFMSFGIGHHNIMERYAILNGTKPIVETGTDFYIVKLPIISDKAV